MDINQDELDKEIKTREDYKEEANNLEEQIQVLVADLKFFKVIIKALCADVEDY